MNMLLNMFNCKNYLIENYYYTDTIKKTAAVALLTNLKQTDFKKTRKLPIPIETL